MARLELNKKYNWQEIVQTYPDLWVIITEVKERAGEIKSCKLLDVCTADERANYMSKYINLNIELRCERTTFNAPNVGILS
ncbi:MAG: hypothetical protein NC548_33920 [Lachnospiraceae bacterium]|nr:hypothetical protein [Lachnospiraceae bacterium]